MKDDIVKLLHKLNNEMNFFLLSNDIEVYVEKIIKNANIISYYKEGELIAFIAFYMNNNEEKKAFLTMLAVDTKFHSQGLGKMLLENSISVLKKNNYKIYELEVDKKNTKAKALYEKFGFVTVEEKDLKYFMRLNII